MMLYITVISVGMSPLISVFIYLSALYILVSLAKGVPIFCIFLKNQLIVSLIFPTFSFYFIYLDNNICYFLSTNGFICCFISTSLWYKVRLLEIFFLVFHIGIYHYEFPSFKICCFNFDLQTLGAMILIGVLTATFLTLQGIPCLLNINSMIVGMKSIFIF